MSVKKDIVADEVVEINQKDFIKSINWEDPENKDDVLEEKDSFSKLLDKYDNNIRNLKENSIVEGIITNIKNDYVTVNVGHKMDGQISKSEFYDLDGEFNLKKGDLVKVYIDKFEDDKHNIVLSKERAKILETWENIERAFESGEIIEGVVMARIKGGFSLEVGNCLKAFLPGSQIDTKPVNNLDKLIGKKVKFKVIKYDREQCNVVVSMRKIIEEELAKQRKSTISSLQVGNSMIGTVKNITDYGAFIDLGGVDGLLHITDMSWGRINHPSQLFEIGKEIEVKILNYDEDKQRVSLGYKQLQVDPWEKVTEKYKPGFKTQGHIVSLADYGAFVELEDGLEGLVHISEMTWSRKIKHPSKIVRINDKVDVVVLSVDIEKRKISLGMKQSEPNPWEVISQKYNIGDIIKCKISNITGFGMFVAVEENIDGLIHISDISWTEKIVHPSSLYKKGDEIEAKILQISPEEERFSLGIKQLEEDPWNKLANDLPVGSSGSGIVKKILKFGAFIDLGNGIEGMVHISELDINNVQSVNDFIKEGDNINFIVLSIDHNERKFSLSRKAYQKKLEGDALKDYLAKAHSPKTTLADAFNKAHNKKNN